MARKKHFDLFRTPKRSDLSAKDWEDLRAMMLTPAERRARIKYAAAARKVIETMVRGRHSKWLPLVGKDGKPVPGLKAFEEIRDELRQCEADLLHDAYLKIFDSKW